MGYSTINEPAQVFHKERVTDAGPGTVWYLGLADGFLIDCGSGHEGKDRAESLKFALEQRLALLHAK